MLIEVTGYDIHDREGAVGVMLGKRVKDGQEVEISVNKTKVDAQLGVAKAANSKTEAGSWHGALINKDMAEHVPVGSWVVAENAIYQKQVKAGGTTRLAYETNWIHMASAPIPEKAIEGIMTADTPVKGHVNNIQVWGKPLSITNNEDEIKALIANYEDRAKSWDPDLYLPRHGFALRAVLRDGTTMDLYDEAAGKKIPTEVATVIDTIYPNEWIYERGDEGQEPKQNRPVSGEDLGNDIDGYSQYIQERFPEGNVDIEVLPYTSYFTSRTHKSFHIDNYNFLLRSMAMTPIRLAQDVPGKNPEEPSVGKNYAVHGILLIIDDKTTRDPKTQRPMVQEQFMAQKFFPNAGNYSGPLHNMLRTADNMPVRVVKALEAPRRENANKATAAPSEEAQQHADAHILSGGFDDVAGDVAGDVGTPFDLENSAAEASFGAAFAMDGNNGFNHDEGSAVEEPAPASAAKPEATPAPASVAEPEAASAPAAGRFRRR